MKDCRTCKDYKSFFEIYDNDPLEESEYGRCQNFSMRDIDANFGEGFLCDFYDSIVFEFTEGKGWDKTNLLTHPKDKKMWLDEDELLD